MKQKKPRKPRISSVVDLACAAFATVWEASPLYAGNRYRVTSHDRGEAKFTLGGGDVSMAEVAARARVYVAGEYWAQAKHPAWAFFRHYNEFIEPPKPKSALPLLMLCGGCGEVHGVNQPCNPRDIIRHERDGHAINTRPNLEERRRSAVEKRS